ncbi:diguanylate cyclase (GGDEF) domain-containing protein [Paraburkholderia lycopersici]|uniref:diguanylate cyclase n=2 Tax=Paraburkholderia lycopersici TaxID=416944 RepID=A0A1G6QWU7_9BURK|nr:diguanylate cyclase (GGDEF) domain-containing protein [Paraburkholderia lycopersici]
MLWLGTAGIGVAMLLASRADAYDRAVQNASNLTLVLERDIQRSIELYDLSLRAVAEGAADPGVMSLPPRLRQQVLFDRAATARYLGPISVLGPNGELLVRSDDAQASERTDRNSLAVPSSLTDAGLHISRPYLSASAHNTSVIALSRRVTRADGTSAGTVVGRLNIDYFRDLLDGLSLGPGGTVAVFETDGTLITRLPYDPAMIGRSLTHTSVYKQAMLGSRGAFVGTASTDGVRRLYVYRHLPGLPIVVDVAPTTDEIFADWWARTRWFAALMLVFTAIKATGIRLLVRELRRRQRAESELKRMAQHDALTGLDNRGTLDTVTASEWRRGKRNGQPLSLLFIDIDNFKAYNDYYGHQAGDETLKAVATCILASVTRPGDHVARYGGEEFVVVLPETGSASALSIAEKVRRAIHELHIEHVMSIFGFVTASIGVSTTGVPGITDVCTLVKAADDAVYKAKGLGRNKVCAAATGDPVPVPGDASRPADQPVAEACDDAHTNTATSARTVPSTPAEGAGQR